MLFPKLNFPEIQLKVKQLNNNQYALFDIIRKKYIVYSPEEWVRQHVVHFLINYKQVPNSLVSIEKQIKINEQSKRYDIVVFTSQLKPLLIVECKAFNQSISQNTANQAQNYNRLIKAPFVLLTNGLLHYAYQTLNDNMVALNTLPSFNEMNLKV